MDTHRACAITTTAPTDSAEHTALDDRQKRLLLVLGLPTFAFALAITVVSTYLPVLARTLVPSTTVIGLIIAGEGVFALFVPLLVGTWSDSLRSRWGGRLPFVAAGAPPALAALAVLGFASSLGLLIALVLVFFLAYFVAYEPYRALYPDLLGDDVAGRSQSTQALARGAGTLLAIVGGGLLFAAARPAPFLAAGLLGILIVAAFGLLILRLRPRPADRDERPTQRSAKEAVADVRALLAEHPTLRTFLVANALWELSLGALKTFVVLYISDGLGHSTTFAAGAIGAAAVFIVLATVASGKLADRLGATRVMEVALWVYGVGLLVPFALSRWPLAVALSAPVVAFGGGVLMTLPFALLMRLMPSGEHGATTGYYSLSRGIGVMLGPILAGAAISVAKPLLPATSGYAAMWGVCSLAILASVPVLRRLRAQTDDAAARSSN